MTDRRPPVVLRVLLLLQVLAAGLAAADRDKVSAGLWPCLVGPLPQAVDPGLLRRSVKPIMPGQLRLRLDVPVTAANLMAIRAAGAVVFGTAPRWNSVLVDVAPAQVAALAAIPAVDRVVLPPRPRHRGTRSGPGPIGDDAGSDIGASLLTAAYGAHGAGQIVGVISDSLRDTAVVGSGSSSGASAPFTLSGTNPQVAGVLPATITVIDYGPGGGSDEGEAMLEEVHSLAPQANLAFSSCGNDDAAFATNIGLLASLAHCQVMCDDVFFADEPVFQDGPIAQAAESFVQGGGIYCSAAGNDADSAVLMTYAPVSGTPDTHAKGHRTGTRFHNWGLGGATPGFLPLTVAPGASISIQLDWNQPFHSYGLGAGSQSDLDAYLFLHASAGSTILASSTDAQGSAGLPSGDPVEWQAGWTNTAGTNQTIYLAVDRYAGTDVPLFRLMVLSDGADLTTLPGGIAKVGTCTGHPTGSGILAIAATRLGSSPTLLEDFSSAGGWGASGMPFYWDHDGNALGGAPIRRSKPDLAAPDGIACWNANFDPFYGTSSATPHVAAAAALLRQVRPDLSGAQLAAALTGTAIDIDQAPASSGPDAWSGYGLVDAFSASGTAVTSVTTTAADGTYEQGGIAVLLGFSHPVDVTGTPRILLNTSPPEFAIYASGGGTTQLTFSYAIAPGDQSARLDAASAVSLQLNGGGIADHATAQAAGITLPIPGAERSLSANAAILIAAVGPSLAITGPGVVQPGQSFIATFTFTQPVTGFGSGLIDLSNGTAGTLSGSGATYQLVITAGTAGSVGVSVAAGAVNDAAGYPLTGAASASFPIAVSGSGDGGGGGGGGGCGVGAAAIFLMIALVALGVRRRR